jgi:hypothetical protein
MNQPAAAPPNPAQVVLTMWGALTMAQFMIVGVGFFLGMQQGVTPTFALDRLLPGDGVGAVLYGLAFVVAVGAVVLPPKLAMKTVNDRSDADRAMVPFLLQMAFAEAATLMGFLGAVFMTQPAVPERLLLPAAAGLVAVMLGFPTASRLKTLAGR